MNRNQTIRTNLSGGTTAPRKGLSQKASVSSASQPGLGRQLSSRVQTGAISQDQAQKVAAQRALLEKTYGPNRRDKVFGQTPGGGYMKKVRQGAAEGKSRYQGLEKVLNERRK